MFNHFLAQNYPDIQTDIENREEEEIHIYLKVNIIL